MTDVKPGLAAWIVWMWLACGHSTHLASEAIPVKNLRAQFLGYCALERRPGLGVY
jgi:hypothetical protein